MTKFDPQTIGILIDTIAANINSQFMDTWLDYNKPCTVCSGDGIVRLPGVHHVDDFYEIKCAKCKGLKYEVSRTGEITCITNMATGLAEVLRSFHNDELDKDMRDSLGLLVFNALDLAAHYNLNIGHSICYRLMDTSDGGVQDVATR